MKDIISDKSKTLLSILKDSLDKDKFKIPLEDKYSEDMWKYIIDFSHNHQVLPLMYYKICESAKVDDEIKDRVEKCSRQISYQNYKMMFATKQITKLLNNNNINNVVLKGMSMAIYYPEPELRKSGDIDILIIDIRDVDKACKILVDNNYRIENTQDSNHHIVLRSQDNIEIELHDSMCEPFEDKDINDYMDNILKEYKDIRIENIMGSINIPVFNEEYNAFYILLHMLQHYMRAGFGLKLLCDWTLLWNKGFREERINKFVKIVDDTGIRKFACLVTKVCVKYLGLKTCNVRQIIEDDIDDETVDMFLKDILESGEFGHSSSDRMVVMKDASIINYLKEFHHQMKLNQKEYSKYYILWPILWVITLYTFLKNNHMIRKVSLLSIFNKTKERSRIIKKVELFKKNI